MSQYDNRSGFQDMETVTHRAASRKGGRARVKKGFAANPELAKRAGRIGGINANQNRKRPKQNEASGSDNLQGLAEILGDIDDLRI